METVNTDVLDSQLSPNIPPVLNTPQDPIPAPPPEESSRRQGSLVLVSLFLIILVGIVIFLSYQNWSLQKQINLLTTTSTTKPSPSPSKCSTTNIPGYEVSNITVSVDSTGKPTTKPSQFQADLKGDGSEETVIIYDQANGGPGGRSQPIITSIFSGSQNCLVQDFTYTGKEDGRSGNELHDAQVFPNFWGDGKTVFDVENESTGYGSASTYFLNFIIYLNGSYQVIQGPTVGSDVLYDFRGDSGVGKEILVATPVWARAEAHFDPHIYQFEKFIWDGQKYDGIKLGTTKNKYQPVGSSTVTLNQIIQKEPDVLK